MDEKCPPTDLDLDVLVKRVRKLVKAYPLIQRITLHELDGELPRYLISVEVENLVTGKPEGGFSDPVPADEIRALRKRGELAKAKKGKKYNFRVVKPEYADLFDVINDWQPDSFPKLIGERFEAIYRPEYLHKLQRLKELKERRLRNGLNKDRWAITEVKEWNATDEWMIELIEPGDVVIDLVEGSCWLLYEKTRGTVAAADSETGISESFKEKERIDQEVEVSPTKGDLPFPCDADTTWEQITFRLKTDELVHAKTPKGEARLHYSQLGFADRRKGDSPNTTTWPLFQALARLNGKIVLQGQDYIRNLPDDARRLNKSLKKLFKIAQSIWTAHYKKHKSYKARFMIRDERNL